MGISPACISVNHLCGCDVLGWASLPSLVISCSALRVTGFNQSQSLSVCLSSPHSLSLSVSLLPTLSVCLCHSLLPTCLSYYLFRCLFLCICHCLCLSVSLFQSVPVSVCLSVSLCLPLCVCIYMFAWPSVCTHILSTVRAWEGYLHIHTHI